MYCNKLLEESRKHDPDVITSLPVHTRDALYNIIYYLTQFLKAIRCKGRVVNIHVVRATAEALQWRCLGVWFTRYIDEWQSLQLVLLTFSILEQLFPYLTLVLRIFD